jgi:Uma2 family endonuclease
MGRRIEKKRPATYADLAATPPHLVAELIDETLYTSPRPSPLHALATGGLYGELRNPFDRGRGGPGGWVILIEPELHLGRDALVPDLSGWRRERLPEVPQTAHIDVAPDWVCEVRSPSTGALDRKIKMPKYAAAGVPWMWLVDPDAQLLEVFRLEEGQYRPAGVHSETDKVRVEPFAAIELDLAELWRF